MKLRLLVCTLTAVSACLAVTVAAAPAAQAHEGVDLPDLDLPDLPEAPEVIVVCDGYITPENIAIPGYVNCWFDLIGTYVQRVGECIYFYDPLLSPIPDHVVPETLEFAFCVRP